MKTNKNFFVIIFLFVFLLLLTGCSNYDEFSNVMIVDGIGIDKLDNKYIISFNAYLENDNYKTFDLEVDDLDNAFTNIYLKTNKKIYLSHLNILLLSSNLSNDDICNIINILNKRNDLRGSFLVTLINNYNNDIFKNESIFLENLINNNYYESGDVFPTTYNDVINDYLNLNISYLPIIDNSDLSITGMHSIFSEYRLYPLSESKYLNLILNKLNSFKLEINEEEINIKNTNIYYRVKNSKIDIYINILYSGYEKDSFYEYLYNKINNLLESNINLNYFYDLVKKYDYSYFKKINPKILDFNLIIQLKEEETTNSKGDNLIEKNY